MSTGLYSEISSTTDKYQNEVDIESSNQPGVPSNRVQNIYLSVYKNYLSNMPAPGEVNVTQNMIKHLSTTKIRSQLWTHLLCIVAILNIIISTGLMITRLQT